MGTGQTHSRRSFLAAVLGAAAAPIVAKVAPPSRQSQALREFDEAWERLQAKLQIPYRHFVVYDSAVMHPGRIERERLLPPPAPIEFVIDRIGIFYPEDSRVNSLAAVCRETSLEIREGKALWASVPLSHLGPGFTRLPLPIRFEHAEDVGIYLHTSEQKLSSVDPVTISIALGGLARV